MQHFNPTFICIILLHSSDITTEKVTAVNRSWEQSQLPRCLRKNATTHSRIPLPYFSSYIYDRNKVTAKIERLETTHQSPRTCNDLTSLSFTSYYATSPHLLNYLERRTLRRGASGGLLRRDKVQTRSKTISTITTVLILWSFLTSHSN